MSDRGTFQKLTDTARADDGSELTIKDKRTGESFCLKGWGLGVTGRTGAGQRAGAADGATHSSAHSDEPPTIGRWYKSDIG
ncbi:MAG: hypothetical protein WBH51_21490 [Mycolicibacter algericus]|uniref:hypothetical protein n=1 Tax=Mycolicibacter algericus TaxID=1288388 RepID=UPI003C74F56D